MSLTASQFFLTQWNATKLFEKAEQCRTLANVTGTLIKGAFVLDCFQSWINAQLLITHHNQFWQQNGACGVHSNERTCHPVQQSDSLMCL